MPFEHTVDQGDSIIKLADRFGLLPNTIWNHPANLELKRKRKDMNVLMPGDAVVIPDKQIKEVEKPTDQKHRFVRKGFTAVYRLQVFDVEEPRVDQDYLLIVDGTTYSGTTDDAGVLEERIPVNAERGELIIGPDQAHIQIKYGHLDPIDELSGVQKRLNNLGFDCGDEEGELGPATRAALLAFQHRFSLAETGEPDQTTRKKLDEFHSQVTEFPPEPQSPSSSGGSNEPLA